MRETPRRHARLWAALLALGLLTACTGAGTDGPSDLRASFSGTAVDDPPVALPAATLVDTDGDRVDLRTASSAPLT